MRLQTSLSLCAAIGAATLFTAFSGFDRIATAVSADAAIATNASPRASTSGGTIVDVAASAGSFETLLAAAQAAGLADALTGDGPFTVFAPSDDAFGKLPKGTVNALLEPGQRDTLRRILSLHVVAGQSLSATDVANRRSLSTLGGEAVAVELDGGGIRIGGARVVAADVAADNGTIHVIDSVILPPQQSIPEVAASAGSFSTLLAAAEAAGLVDALSGDGPFTVLAPTDEAFAKLPSDLVQALLLPANREKLVSILTLHVIPGRVSAADALGGVRGNSLNGQAVDLRFDNGRLRAGDATVIAADIAASNGIVHAIDQVLIPEGFTPPATGPLVIGVFRGHSAGEVRRALGVDSHTGYVIDRVSRDGGAADAGLRSGDVIVTVDGKPASPDVIDAAKQRVGAGGTLRLVIARVVEVEVRADH